MRILGIDPGVAFCAPPYPATACLTCIGVYSKAGMPARSASRRRTPLPWATAMPVVMFFEKNSSSTAISWGLNCSSSWDISCEI